MLSLSTRHIVVMIAVSTCLIEGQVFTPAEISALPSWSGEEAASKMLPPHYVFRDTNGQIVVSYTHQENPGHRVTFRFWLPNRVQPQVTSTVARIEESDRVFFVYSYKLRNAASAISPIVQWSIVGPANQEVTPSHPVWKSYNAKVPVAPQALLPEDPNGAFIVWRAVDVPQISPGNELGNFTLRSSFLPGLTTAYASGDGILEEPEGEFPEPVVQELIPLQRPYVWQKPFLTIGPRFAPGTALPAIKEAFRRDVASLIREGLLSSESAYVQELIETLRSSGSVSSADLIVKAPPQLPIENDINNALKMSAAAGQ